MEKVFSTTLNLWRLEGLPRVREHFEGVEVREVREQDVKVITETHRDKDLVRNRFDAGYPAYWVDVGGKCGHVVWFAIDRYSLWDLRCELLLPINSLYLFDAFTPPEFRRKGYGALCILGALELRQQIGNQILYLLVQAGNDTANAMVPKMGFERIAVASLTQLPPLRRYKILLENGEKRTLFRTMRIRTKPAVLDLERLEFSK